MKRSVMKKHSVTSIILTVSLITLVCTFIGSCSKADKKENTQLLTADQLTTKDKDYLAERGFVESGERIVSVYYPIKITAGGVLLTDKKIVVFSDESTEKELLENIFDLSSSHALSPEKKSKITLYRKDDSQFSCEFPGGLDIDEVFFSKLRTSWRAAIAEKQDNVATQDTSEGVMLGVKEKKEEKNKLTLEK